MIIGAEVINLTITARTQQELYNKVCKLLRIDEQDNPLYYLYVDHTIPDPDDSKKRCTPINISLAILGYNRYIAVIQLFLLS